MLLDEMLNYNLYKKMYGGVISPELLFRSKRLLEGNYLLKEYDDINDIMVKGKTNDKIIAQIKRDFDRQIIYINGIRIKEIDVDNTIKNGEGNIKNDQMINLLNLCMQGVLSNLTEIILTHPENFYGIKDPQMINQNTTYIDIRIKNGNIKYKLTYIINIKIDNLYKKYGEDNEIYTIYLGYNQFFENSGDYNTSHFIVGENHREVYDRLLEESNKFPIGKYFYKNRIDVIEKDILETNKEYFKDIKLVDDIKFGDLIYNHTEYVAIPRYNDIEPTDEINIIENINLDNIDINDDRKIKYICSKEFLKSSIGNYHLILLYGYKYQTKIQDIQPFNEVTNVYIKKSEDNDNVIILIANKCDYGKSGDKLICNIKTRIYIKNNDELNKMEIICKPILQEIIMHE